jgi:proton-translocating NADH-quinone oxidoreductase chain N
VQALFILVPLAAFILLNLPFRQVFRKSAFVIALLVAAFQMVLSLTSGIMLWTNFIEIFKFNFISQLSVDFLSLVVLFTVGLVTFTALIVGVVAYSRDRFNLINMILILMMGMNGVLMVRDLFSLYVFLEITAVSSFIMIAMEKGIEGFEGAFKYLIMSAVATIFLLSAIGLVFLSIPDLSFSTVGSCIKGRYGAYPPHMIAALILFVAGLAIKAGVVPFHGWLPDAYMSAPAPVSILLAGIVTKVAGVYTIIRLVNDVFNNMPVINSILMAFGSLSIVVGALAAMGQSDFKRILAYSSISQIGYIILAVGIGTPLAYAGALLHFFNHATFKSLLFVNSSAVENQAGTRDINLMGGLAGKMPVTGGTSVVGFLSTMGKPPLAGFWSKLVIIVAAWFANYYIYSVIAVLASILTLAYFLILQRKVFFGKIAPGMENVREGNAGFTIPALILAAVTVLLGLTFPLIIQLLQTNGLLKIVI